MFKDIGILGVGLWEGPVIGNDHFEDALLHRAQVKDPYKGMRDDRGVVRVGGLSLTPDRFARTIAVVEESFRDPYRGTRRRRYFPDDIEVSDAEADAGRRALAQAGVAPAQIGAVLVQSFLPDEMQPRNAALVAHKLGIVNAPAFEVDTMCNSALSQLTVAASLITAGVARHVLCVQSAAYSRVTDPTASSTVQEADLASAFVIGPIEGALASVAWETDGRLHAAVRLGWGLPAGARPRRYWDSAPDRLLIRFDPDLQPLVNAQTVERAPSVCKKALEAAGLRMSDVDVFVTHQPIRWFGTLLLDVLGLPSEVLVDSFEEYANVNSACIPASLALGLSAGRIRRGSRVLVFGPAAGYTFGAAAIRW
jgi:3-oxoacyl-[acyl-carrier-protein] synthase-3